ncbi:MAG TPA: DNA polymerase III subunit gamma/tau, partial [Sphingobacteriaceae bacterium]
SSSSFLLSALNIANQCDLNYKTSRNQRLQVELALIKMAHINSVINLSSLPATDASLQPEGLKKKPETLVPPPAAPPKEAPVKIPVTLNESPASPSIAREPAPEPIRAPEEKPKPVLNGSLLKASASIIPDLKTLSDPNAKKEEDKPDYIRGEQRNEFTSDKFLKIWNEYAETIKKAGKINLFTIMTANAPFLKENFIIEVVIENKIQETQLMMEKIDLLNFLRVELQNYAIEIETRQAEQNTKRKLYTSTEKYQHMVEKNPNLEEFRKRFNLGLD